MNVRHRWSCNQYWVPVQIKMQVKSALMAPIVKDAPKNTNGANLLETWWWTSESGPESGNKHENKEQWSI